MSTLNRNPQFPQMYLEYLQAAIRRSKLAPIWLGGTSGSGGGVGGPPGGFIGRLPQTLVAYDTSEAETLAGNTSLLDNLNHIRYRLGELESVVDTSGSSGAFSEAAVVGARIYRTTSQSISASDNANIGFNAETYDTDNQHSTVTDNDRLYCVVAGIYLVTAQVFYSGNESTGGNVLKLVHSTRGTLVYQDMANMQSGSLAALVDLDVGDYLTLNMTNPGPATMTVLSTSGSASGEYSPYLSFHLLRDQAAMTSGSAIEIRENGSFVGNRRTLNFIEGNGISITATDSEINNRVNLTFETSLATSGSGMQIQENGGTLTGFKPKLNLIEGSGISIAVSDNQAQQRVDVTIATSGSAASTSGSDAIPLAGWTPWGQTLTYDSADDPTYVARMTGFFTNHFSAGMRLRVNQTTGGTKYFIITRVEYSDPNTLLYLFGGTDYDLANEAINSPYYSVVKAPYGMPLSPEKWKVELVTTSGSTYSSLSNGVWYNIRSHFLDLPIGSWWLEYAFTYQRTGADFDGACTSLSTSDTGATDTLFNVLHRQSDASWDYLFTKRRAIDVTIKTRYYSIVRKVGSAADFGVTLTGSTSPFPAHWIRAVSAFL